MARQDPAARRVRAAAEDAEECHEPAPSIMSAFGLEREYGVDDETLDERSANQMGERWESRREDYDD